jgi:hypothetical protein
MPSKKPHPLVLKVLRTVGERTRDKAPPYWVSVASLNLDEPEERIGAAVALAALNGWVSVGGKPAHSVMITPAGLEQIKSKRHGPSDGRNADLPATPPGKR